MIADTRMVHLSHHDVSVYKMKYYNSQHNEERERENYYNFTHFLAYVKSFWTNIALQHPTPLIRLIVERSSCGDNMSWIIPHVLTACVYVHEVCRATAHQEVCQSREAYCA